jgi:ribosomal protein S18 acetylase RimI-like enzyme
MDGTTMDVRTFQVSDLERLIALTVETFGPYYEESFRSIVGDTVMKTMHGDWREDYRRQLAGLHQPDAHKHVAVAEQDGVIVGFVAWQLNQEKRYGQVDFVAVDTGHRRRGIAAELCRHAFADMRERGMQVVEIGTGGDPFHRPARALYENLGMTAFPVVYYYKEL